VNVTAVEPPLKRLLLGGAIGAAAGAVAWPLAGAFEPAVFSLTYAAAFVLGAAGVCAVGRLVFRRSLGPVAGMLLGFLLGFGMGHVTAATASPLVGQAAPIAGTTLDGTTLDVSTMRGKVVLVDFWNTGCPPCVASMPKLKSLREELHGDGLEIVGVSTDGDRGKVERFVRSRGIDWPQLLLVEQDDRMTDFVKRKLAGQGLPFVILVGRDGRIAAAGVPSEEVERSVRQLLGEGELKPTPQAPVPTPAWALAAFGALVAAFFQRGAEAGAGRT
jgi:thiol-disulfide isomerase/thioredoxin